MSKPIGSKIRTAREKAGLGQRHLAKLLAISPQSVSAWESGTSYPKYERLEIIARYLGVDPGSLVSDTAAPDDPRPSRPTRATVPLVPWRQIGSEVQAGRIRVPDTIDLGENAFATRLTSDAMQSRQSGAGIPKGSILVVDPGCPLEVGDVVVVHLHPDDPEPAIGKLTRQGKQGYIAPENDRYPLAELPEEHVYRGRVRYAITEW